MSNKFISVREFIVELLDSYSATVPGLLSKVEKHFMQELVADNQEEGFCLVQTLLYTAVRGKSSLLASCTQDILQLEPRYHYAVVFLILSLSILDDKDTCSVDAYNSTLSEMLMVASEGAYRSYYGTIITSLGTLHSVNSPDFN